MALNFPICMIFFDSLNREKLIQYVIIENKRIPKTIFDEKF